MKKTHILFDLDGTLLDSTDAIISTFYHSFETLDFKFTGSKETIKSLIGYPLEIMYERLGIAQNEIPTFVKAYKTRYTTISKQQTSLMPDALNAIELASSFARLGVVTTKTGSSSIGLLEHLGILPYFEIVTGRENVTHPKPHPEPIVKTMELMNITSTQHVWMIGDTILDLIAAQKAHVNSVGVLCGYGKPEDLQRHTQYITDNTLKAIEHIYSLTQES